MNDTDQNEPTIQTQQPDTETSPQPSRPINLPIVPPKPKWHERKLLWVVLAIAFVIGGAGTGYAYYVATTKQADTNPVVASETPKPSPSASPKTFAPVALQFVKEKQATTGGAACLMSDSTVYRQPLTGEEAVTSLTVPDHQLVTMQAPVRDERVIQITSPGCSSKEGPGIWLSKDAGKTYAQLYKGKPHPKDSLGEQITSTLLADDGKTVVFASVPEPEGKGTVKSLDTATGTVTDMFTVNDSGVHLQAYDQKNKLMYYYAGCYNCDGFSFGKPLIHDLAKNTDTALFDDKDYRAYASVMNRDATKILRTKNKGEVIPKINLTYVIEEFDVKTKKTTEIATFKRTDESGRVNAGYTAGGSVYYTNDKDLFVVADGKSKPVLRTPLPITAVHYVNDRQAILSQGDFMRGSVVNFAIDSNSSTKLLDYEYPTAVLGISLQ